MLGVVGVREVREKKKKKKKNVCFAIFFRGNIHMEIQFFFVNYKML